MSAKGPRRWSTVFGSAQNILSCTWSQILLKAGAIAGASAFITNQIGGAGFNWAEKAVVHGVAQGGLSVAQGGSFKSAFLSAAFTSAGLDFLPEMDIASGTAVAAVIGGTGSVIGGGKFANGAVTGAFIYAYNHKGPHSLTNPSGKGVRGQDLEGNGRFGAPRARRDANGNIYTGSHEGADFMTTAGQDVRAISGGRVIRLPQGGGYDGIVVGDGAGTSWKILYLDVKPSIRVGDPILAGQVLGTAQDITIRYGPNMTNHIHVKLRLHGSVVDPARFIPLPNTP